VGRKPTSDITLLFDHSKSSCCKSKIAKTSFRTDKKGKERKEAKKKKK
jgi:hypothetical protein